MSFSNDDLNDIYDRASGRCHICHKKLTFKNYGVLGSRGAWEVEHSNPRARGGTNRLNNLYPACISCNRSKGAGSTKSARAAYGKTKAPLSTSKREQAKLENAVAGGIVGGLIGAALGGRPGAAAGAVIGATLGHKKNPDE